MSSTQSEAPWWERLINKAGDVVSPLIPLGIFGIIVGGIFSTKLGDFIKEYLFAGANFFAELGKAGVEELRHISRKLRWVIVPLIISIIGGTIALVAGLHEFGVIFTLITGGLSLLAFLAIRAVLDAAFGAIRWLNIGQHLAKLTFTAIAMLAIGPMALIGINGFMWLVPLALTKPIALCLLAIVGVAALDGFMRKLVLEAIADLSAGTATACRWFTRAAYAALIVVVVNLSYHAALEDHFGPLLKTVSVYIDGKIETVDRAGAKMRAENKQKNAIWYGTVNHPIRLVVTIKKTLNEKDAGKRLTDATSTDSAIFRQSLRVRYILDADQAETDGLDLLKDPGLWKQAYIHFDGEPPIAITFDDLEYRITRTGASGLGWPSTWVFVPRSYVDIGASTAMDKIRQGDSPQKLRIASDPLAVDAKVTNLDATANGAGAYTFTFSSDVNGGMQIGQLKGVEAKAGQTLEFTGLANQLTLHVVGGEIASGYGPYNGRAYGGPLPLQGFKRCDYLENFWAFANLDLRLVCPGTKYGAPIFKVGNGNWRQMFDPNSGQPLVQSTGSNSGPVYVGLNLAVCRVVPQTFAPGAPRVYENIYPDECQEIGGSAELMLQIGEAAVGATNLAANPQ